MLRAEGWWAKRCTSAHQEDIEGRDQEMVIQIVYYAWKEMLGTKDKVAW